MQCCHHQLHDTRVAIYQEEVASQGIVMPLLLFHTLLLHVRSVRRIVSNYQKITIEAKYVMISSDDEVLLLIPVSVGNNAEPSYMGLRSLYCLYAPFADHTTFAIVPTAITGGSQRDGVCKGMEKLPA